MPTDRRAFFMTTLAASIAAPAILRARQKKRWPDRVLDPGLPGLELEDRSSTRRTSSATPRSSCEASRARWTSPRSPSSRARGWRRRRRISRRSVSWSRTSARPRACTRRTPAREKQLDEGRRFIDLAHAMGVKYVRMFGDKMPEGEPREEVLEARHRGIPADGRARQDRGRHRAASSRTATSRTRRPRRDPDAVSAPMPSRSSGTPTTRSWPATRPRPTPTPRSAAGSATRTSRTRGPDGAGPAVRADRHGRGAGQGAGAGAGQGRLQGLLLLRVGEEVAPGDRGARGRVPALREDHAEYLKEAGVKPA